MSKIFIWNSIIPSLHRSDGVRADQIVPYLGQD